ncbi:MAG: T9SS type A sorting domain-containing protein [Bacteroidales bacterium]|nr:T9SS type A sorting domain-containing protein [Bacteroidales bacterium]MCF8345172.1 T9SS type A sorting domain-containing protein [Bacteroidales bacterium]MCF8350063.1 T9SS type A sorting domain-containing protein [Bacteroidales bacterium]MCF8374993.1 T9SS type A sorting domain-containing protein [Bacteroidales bacterium]
MKKKARLITTIVLFIGHFLPGSVYSQQTIYDTITHDGIQRNFILYVPDSYDPAEETPLLFNLHGYGSNAFEQMHYGDFRPIADTSAFLLVHPNGTVDNVGNTHWNVGWGTSSVDDVGFISALIDSLSTNYMIDPEKIYSTGMSNGGFMSYLLACELSNRIAAIASVTGSMTKGLPNSCSPDHPMPVMEIHGTADFVVPYDGALWVESIEAVLNYWVDFNACDSTPIITDMPDNDTTDGSTVEHQRFMHGDNGVEVEHFKVIGGGHTWPGSAYGGQGTNRDIDASAEIWAFFSKYDINGAINQTGIDPPIAENSLILYPNPVSRKICIESRELDKQEYKLFSGQGRLLRSGTLKAGYQEIDISHFAPGLYVLRTGSNSYPVVKTQ